jgi:alpha-L-fucosidase 2
MNNKLMYKTPAATFQEALPIGNGSFGAMVYGGFPNFKYSLNLDTLWSGTPNQQESFFVPPEMREKARAQIKAEQYFAAQETVQQYMTSQKYNESYVSAGFLNIYFPDLDEPLDYLRELDLNTASVNTTYRSDQAVIKTQSFVSCADQVLLTDITADRPISIEVKQNSLLKHQNRTANAMLVLKGEAPAHVEPNYVDSADPILYDDGMKFLLQTKVHVTDGTLSFEQDTMKIAAATKIILVTTGVTGFRGWNQELEVDDTVLERECQKHFDSIKSFNQCELKKRHEQVYHPLFSRVTFSLMSTEQSEIPLDIRLERLKNDSHAVDLGLFEILFQYGRYMTICCSFPNHSLAQPSNLQGLWCEDIRPMWSSNFTVNINTEMNYWLTGPLALSECDEPLIQMIAEIAVAGQSTATDTLGSSGFAVCHNVDIWRQTTPVKGMVKWSFWPMGGIWLATHVYRHYLYTGNLEFLEQQAYPILKGAAQFCLGWLYEEDGILHSSPSTSPENTFLDHLGRSCATSDSATMDIALIREILTETAASAAILEQDLEFALLLQEAVKKLPEYQLGQYGQLMEWSKDFAEEDPHHRHFAHLVGFHPFHQIDFDERAELLTGVEQVLKRRTEGMKEYIGWDEAWLTNFYARLRQGDKAEAHLLLFLKYCAYQNLFSLHPPLGENDKEREIFQIDGNFGITAGIAEMLLQSKPGYLDLLPALPPNWKNGEITGMKIVGAHTVTIKWRENELYEAQLQFRKKEPIIIRCKTPFVVETQTGNQTVSWKTGDYYQMVLMGEKNSNYCIKKERR